MSRPLEIAALTAVLIAVWVLYLYRKKRLKEDHAILWLFVSVSIVVLSVWTDLLLAIQTLAGAGTSVNIVFASFVAFILVTCIYYSVKISELTEQNRKLVQEAALLRRLTRADADKQAESDA